MEKNEFCTKLREYPKSSEFMLEWDRGNGSLERVVVFWGFKKTTPRLYFKQGFKEGRNLVDIKRIGGYESIISLTPIM